MSHSIAIVCEGPTDPPSVIALTDKLIVEFVDYARDNVTDHRNYRGFREGDPYLAWKRVKTLAREHDVVVLGHLDDDPASNESRTALKALLLLDKSPDRPDAVLLIRDTEGDDRRREWLVQARDHAPPAFRGRVVLGIAHRMRECWHLVGFEPATDEERECLRRITEELSFHPCRNTDRLTGDQDHEPRSPKYILHALTAGDRGRALCCLTDHTVAELSRRGAGVGLSEFLTELRSLIYLLFGGVPPEASGE